jgi:hypothetical protein
VRLFNICSIQVQGKYPKPLGKRKKEGEKKATNNGHKLFGGKLKLCKCEHKRALKFESGGPFYFGILGPLGTSNLISQTFGVCV